MFPILIYAAARARKAKSSLESSTTEGYLPRVCMVVASYNEAATLPDKLKNTWELDYPADRFRLVIGSDGSSDASHELLSACNDPRLVKHLFTERRGKISVLNDLVSRISESDAEILVFSDANTMFAPDALRKLVGHFQDPKVGCVSGELKLEKKGGVSGEGFYWRYENWIRKARAT
ncbi:MAG: glycosyltransferase [Armatimonas sp.]